MARLFLALFLASQALGATIKLPSNVYPVGLAAAADGTLWYVGAFAEAGRVLPSGEVERLQLPAPFYVERSAGIVVLGDGTVLIGSATGVIARVDRQMNASLIDLGDRYTVERLPAYGFATHISVIGEPRAARLAGRRRASRS